MPMTPLIEPPVFYKTNSSSRLKTIELKLIPIQRVIQACALNLAVSS